MSTSGRINIDALVHDTVTGSIKILDIESSKSVTTKTALVTGSASALGTVIDPSETSYIDSSGAEVVFASVDTLVIQSSSQLTLETADIKLKNEAGKCAVSATPGHTTGNITISGSGSFSLLIIGE
jgi:anti-anti-sigma regulatory factor